MRRIKVLLMLLAIVAGGSFAYGQTSPQDTYYKFNQTYAAGATVAPYVGDGGDLTVKQAVISLPDNSYPKHYLDQTYYFGMPIVQSTLAQRITIDASSENPAHIFIVGNCTTNSPSILKLAFNTYDNVIDQWQPLSNIITTRESSCVVELTTTHSGEHLLYMSNTAGDFYLSEIRVLYEQNETWTNIRNSLSLELNQTTTTTDNPEVAYFFRLQGSFLSTGSEGYYISHATTDNRLARNISFKPYADGTIAMKAIKRTDGDHDYFYVSVLTRPYTYEKSESSYRRYEAPTTVTDFSFPVQKGVEYVIDGTIAVPEIRFIPDHYTVTLDANGGTVDPTELVYIKDGDPITAFPTPTNGNYMFDGWDPDAPSFPYAPTADITYTAQWTNPHGQCGDNLDWEYDPTTHTLTISGSGDMNSYTTSNRAPWYEYRNAITDVVLPDGLTTIGNCAFMNCTALTSITIPSTVTNINAQAFRGCTSLPSIVIPEGVTYIQSSLFSGCTALTSVTIPSSVTIINAQAFYNCTSLTSITLPEGLKTINVQAFMGCTNLASVYIPSSVTVIYDQVFSGCSSLTDVIMPDGTSTLGFNNKTFYNCTSLTSITLPSRVKIIPDNSFNNCPNLADVYVSWKTLPTKIYANAFTNIASPATLHVLYGTSSLYTSAPWTNFNIVEMNPSGQCGDDLFWEYDPSSHTLTITGTGDMYDYTTSTHAPWYDYRTEITDVVLPDGMTKIGNFAFYQCNNASLTSINIPASVTSIGNNAFKNCSSLASVTIPSGVTSIGNSAFYGCSSLESITIPSGVTTITTNAFLGCSSLTSLVIPSGVTNIEANAFQNCTGLKTIDIPSSVVNITYNVFQGCTGLTDVTVNWTDLTGVTTQSYAFNGVTVANVKLHVPCGMTSEYSGTAPWSSFNIVDPCAGNYPVTANGDPDNAGIYYSTFYYGSAKYAVPANVEAYAASVNGSDLVLTKIADAADVLPAGTAVILKSTINSYTMVPSDETAVTITATNHLHGVDVDTDISSVITSGSCYVLSYKSGYGVGFYLYEAPNQLKAHKAYINLDGSGAAQAPRHLRFVFNSTTGIEDVQGEKVQGEKFLRDGVLYIQRGEQLYNAQGMRVE